MEIASQNARDAWTRFGGLACVLLALAVTTLSCVSSNGKTPEPARPQPPATLIVFVRDSRGEPIEGCDVVIQTLKIGDAILPWERRNASCRPEVAGAGKSAWHKDS
jgi:hypothetical protein